MDIGNKGSQTMYDERGFPGYGDPETWGPVTSPLDPRYVEIDDYESDFEPDWEDIYESSLDDWTP